MSWVDDWTLPFTLVSVVVASRLLQGSYIDPDAILALLLAGYSVLQVDKIKKGRAGEKK